MGAEAMVVEWDVEIPMDDGTILRADVFRPADGRPAPVILSHGPYGKGLSFQEGRAEAWRALTGLHPEILDGSTNRYQCWEVVDPERFVPEGYVCVRVDSRGAGRSPGFLDPLSAREVADLYRCIEWAGTEPWSTGRVGLLGISYYAINQWQVAGLRPPHLAAICPWEGAADPYRDMSHHGGILSTFWESWYERRVLPVQHGVGARGYASAVTGELVAGPETLSEAELAANRADFPAALRAHGFDDEFYAARAPRWDAIDVPILSCANWGGQGLHGRGNFEGYLAAASRDKWLEVHGGAHWEEFYTDYGLALEQEFFARFLKGEDNGFGRDWRVQLLVRGVDGFTVRREQEWPLARTAWTPYYLDPKAGTLGDKPGAPSAERYDALGTGITVLGEPLSAETEITGPLVAHLFVSTTAADADLFLVLRAFDPEGHEVLFRGAQDHRAPIAQGWLRLSHRGLDPERSLPWRPYYRHGAAETVVAGEIYEVAVELWPTSIVLPAGYRLALSVRGRDFQIDEDPGERGIAVRVMNGSGRCIHDDPEDRAEARLAGEVTIFGGEEHPSRLVLPVIA